MPVKKRVVKAVEWPSTADAESRLAALRLRDSELGELVVRQSSADRIAELEKQVRYLKAFSLLERAKNPWWVVMQVRYVLRAVAKRLLRR